MELAISPEHHPEHVNAPERAQGQAAEQQQQTQHQLCTSPCNSGVFSACVGGQVTAQSLVHSSLCRVESVKRAAGEVNRPDKIKLLDVAFTFDVLC